MSVGQAALLTVAVGSLCALLASLLPVAAHLTALSGPLLPGDIAGASPAEVGRSTFPYVTYAFVAPVVVALSFVTVGAIIAWRLPGERGPLLFSLLLVGFGDVFAVGALAPTPVHTSVLGRFLVESSFVSIAVSSYLFPNGRLIPRWTRWPMLVWLYVAVTTSVFALSAFDPSTWPNAPSAIFWLSLIASSPIAQVYRYRRVSGPVERQQTKWVALGLSIFVVTLMLYGAHIPVPPHLVAWRQLLVGLLLMASLLLIPLTIGIAMLRYRLWDVDALINRTLVYGPLTLTLAALYIGGVIALQSLFRIVSGQSSDVAIAIVTLAIAALFNPWRRRVQRFIDRRFYRHKYDAAHILGTFGSKLRDEVDLDQLQADLIAVAQETMEPASVALWLSGDS